MAFHNLHRFFPFLIWLPPRSEDLKADLLAGITVALLAIPQSIAYAQLAGVPAHYGLYAALLPTLIGAMFGSSPALSTGPVAMTSLLTAASIGQLAPQGSEQFYAYAVTLALVSGLLQILFGVLRMGILLNFLSYPVLMGFINAAAIIIGLSQLPTLLGMKLAQSDHFLLDIWSTMTHLDTLHGMSLGFGLAAIALLFAFRKWAPRLPGMLAMVAILTLASYLLGYARLGGIVVGDIPRGLPGLSLPQLDWPALQALIPGAFMIALISFMEAMSSCKVIAIKTRTPWDDNQELIGQGLAKLAAAASHAMPVSGSFSRSALNLAAGARTGMSSIVAAAAVLVTLLLFTPALYHLPKPVLAAIIIVAVSSLVDYASIRKAWRAGRDDGIAAIITFAATLAFAPNIQIGILAGIILSLSLLLYRMMRPRVAILGLHDDGALRDAQRLRLPELHPELGAIRFDGSLIFVNVSYFEDAILKLENNNPRLKYILIAAGGINALDASGVEVLANLAVRLRANGMTLTFSSIKQQVRDVMEQTGLMQKVGTDHIFATDAVALETLLERLRLSGSAERID
jgi:SulP family sulfate permease